MKCKTTPTLVTRSSACSAKDGRQFQHKLKRVINFDRLSCNEEDLAKHSFTTSQVHCLTLQSRQICYIVEYSYW